MKLATAFDQASLGNKLNLVIESTIPNISFPIISKGSNWIRVNDIVIREKNDSFVVSRKSVELGEFSQKSWAIAFAVAYCQSNFNTCTILKEYNKRLDKCLEEIHRYNYHLDSAKNKNNTTRERIISDRLSRTFSEYTLIMDEISPLIKSQSNV
jgi:hypothetical protein